MTQYCCKNKDRWRKVLDSATINGIDYLEINPDDQKKINVYFLHPLPGEAGGIPANPPLTTDNIVIEGGVRIKNINVIAASVSSVSSNMLQVSVDNAGDFSTYTLKIAGSSTAADIPPTGFDLQLSAIDFSFKINCPNEFDCKTDDTCAPGKLEDIAVNYLAKDYASFTRLMLDRLSNLLPGWQERSEADAQIMLIELLAYIGDHLSYYQDAVATEAYIGTARRRISLRRHARLLDYMVHDGCNARTWISIEVEKGSGADNNLLSRHTVMLTNDIGSKTTLTEAEANKLITEEDALVFETMHDIELHNEHNCILFYTWDDNVCHLPEGATSATLLRQPSLFLKKGDVLLFEELYSPVTGLKADADANKRHAVRLAGVFAQHDELANKDVLNITWDAEDALPFTLCISNNVMNDDNTIPANQKSVARGNVVLADHGQRILMQSLVPAAMESNEKFYPKLPAKNITGAAPYNHNEATSQPAYMATLQDPHNALAVVSLDNAGESWAPQQDLLGSDAFATEFVVETEQEGTSYLRFGDDVQGKKPAKGFAPQVNYRVGNGRSGNVGRETIRSIVWASGGITSVTNLLPAQGGTDAESMEQIRQFAPQAFRTQERAVTAADYVAKTQLHPEVQKAAAKFYWTGSWYTVYIIIDRKGSRPIDEGFKQEIILHLEQYRMAGYDLEICQPVFVSLDIVLNVCVRPGYFQSNVKESLAMLFSSHDMPDGNKGFFHPDNFTFGQPVYLSAIYKQAMQIPGVASVEIKKFNPWNKAAANEIQNGILTVSELQIIRADSDPNFPENGKIEFIMLGGL